MTDIRSILYLPKDLKSRFINICRNRNGIVLMFLAVFGILMQSFNIIRVLVLSNAKLTTLNNRIYFSLYLFMLVISISYLTYHIWFDKNERVSRSVNAVCMSVFIVWNTCLTVYDTYSGGSAEISVFIISLLVFSSLFLHHPYYMLTNILGCYLLFLICTAHFQNAGSIINLTIAVILGSITSVNSFWVKISDLRQEQNIADINKLLKDEENRFRLTCDQYDMLLKNTHDILFVWDLKDDEIKFSDNWHDILGFPVKISGFSSWLMEHSEQGKERSSRIKNLRDSLKSGKSNQEEELHIKSVDGREIWYKMRLMNQFDKNGFPRFGVGILNDITAQKQVIVELEREIQKDQLTGVLNKTAVEMRIKKYLKDGDKHKGSALLVIDLDDFKMINDKFGHPCGDYVLMECASALKEVFNKDADIGRIGGDEFIVFIHDIKDKELYDECDKVIKKLDGIYWRGAHVNASCSIGVAARNDNIREYAQLYYDADDAMYMAKRSGKGKVYIYDHKTDRKKIKGA